MSDPDISRLTDKQKECLRLVAQNLNTKQIARQIGKSDHAVNQRVRQALRALGVADRFEAARILSEVEGRQTYQPLIYQPEEVAIAPQMSIVGGQEMPVEHQALRIPPLGGRDNDLDALQRMKWILSLALMIGGTVAALVAAGLWIMSFFS
ncbi:MULTISPECIES: helix-turn-helix transcriptional regulator [Sphingobium]|jgi:DNA-binding CsgD family transcriptional regulator|uniref:HTH luxR-type domain-containing protein n=1 Tax=Sphingobium fuliginis (strain ATCC 27551) TaxID=336203 RepID=A0ABQ1EM88_SPHSA|nr:MULTISPECIES: helix-turn-helix transcriptional regulator [Sphingobium]RYM01069.1 LuxR family transcriptional regulator [Sphingobium fuliginis]UXC89708.1 helix-turn-helix transcriptional regulator [Sphingobium sp. RSMS]GFZ78342.1 hypothetical protein GCM10019071_03460 [Sphingobium fuliginis]